MDEPNVTRQGHKMDELTAVQRLLAEPPPEPDVVEAARVRLARISLGGGPAPNRLASSGWRPRGAAGSAPRPLGLPEWLAPAAAAAAVAVVITASLAISSAIQRHPAGAGPAAGASSVFAKVPPYFVALTKETPGPAAVGATATGAVLGTVAPPKPYTEFTMVAAAGDGRTFVLAAARELEPGPAGLYRLVLTRSGHPGRLARLPIPPETEVITGLAVSPDGSKLAVSVVRSGKVQAGSKVQVFSMATGAKREWEWPGAGWIGWNFNSNEFDARSLSWAADNRRLLFEAQTHTSAGVTAQARLLDTAAPASDLRAASAPVPIPGAVLSPRGNPRFYTTGPLLLTGDGTKIIAPTSRNISDTSPAGQKQHRAAMLAASITVFSVRTGKPLQVLLHRQLRYENGSSVLWVNNSGTVMIVGHPLPHPTSYLRDSVIGVQTPAAFTPLPPAVQHYFLTGQPDW